MYFIAIGTGIAIQSILFLSHIYSSIHYLGVPSEKIQYYTISNIPFVTTMMYSFALVSSRSNSLTPELLNYFFIEWMMTTPLFIINIGRILHIKLYKYFLLSTAAVAMNFCGYLAHTLPRPDAYVVVVGGGACYLYLVGFLGRIYFHRKRVENTGTDGCIRNSDAPFTLRVAKALLIGIISIWSVYPIIYFLYMLEILILENTIVAFVILDFLSKGVTTSLLIGYYDSLYRRNTLFRFLAGHRRIYPQPMPAALTATTTTIPIQPIQINPPDNIIELTIQRTPQYEPQQQRTPESPRIKRLSTPQIFEDM